MRVAVIGGGLFGCTTAIHLARAGHAVHLYDAKADLMCGATAATYARLHRGYHYPRSPETGRESRAAEASFRAEYGEAVIDGGKQAYLVAEGGHVTPDQYRAFLEGEDLQFFQEDNRFDVVEPRVNLTSLVACVRRKVADSGVTARLGTRITKRTVDGLRDGFDRIVVASYSRLNAVLGMLGCEIAEYKFQIVEKPVVRLPDEFRSRSIVVIDGPFGCIDPLDDTPFHVLGHVVRTIHAENVGYGADIPAHLANCLDRGLTPDWTHTRFRAVADDLARYVPGVETAEHVASTLTVRAVLAGVEKTDARPTLVERMDSQVIKVFSGKLGTAVRAARDVEREVDSTYSFEGGILRRAYLREVVIPSSLGGSAEDRAWLNSPPVGRELI
jgi:glycine/D-amino acid oxidase-like deaminating enzyme